MKGEGAGDDCWGAEVWKGEACDRAGAGELGADAPTGSREMDTLRDAGRLELSVRRMELGRWGEDVRGEPSPAIDERPKAATPPSGILPSLTAAGEDTVGDPAATPNPPTALGDAPVIPAPIPAEPIPSLLGLIPLVAPGEPIRAMLVRVDALVGEVPGLPEAMLPRSSWMSAG